MTGSASRNSWVGFSSRPDDFAAKSAGTRLGPLFLTSHLGLDLGLIERLQQAFSDQPPHENQLARIVQIAWEIAHPEPFRRQRMAHRRSGMQWHGDLVAMETQDERFLVLIYQIGKERPATDNTVETDIADLRQRSHLVSQKRGTTVDEAFREALADFVGIDFRRGGGLRARRTPY